GDRVWDKATPARSAHKAAVLNRYYRGEESRSSRESGGTAREQVSGRQPEDGGERESGRDRAARCLTGPARARPMGALSSCRPFPVRVAVMKKLILAVLVACNGPSCLAAGPPSALPRSSPEAQGVSSAAVLEFVEAADRDVDALHSFM